MTAPFASIAAGTLAVAAAALAFPAMAMPVGTTTLGSGIVTVSGWADRAQGKTHTYSQPYAYGYGYGNGGYAPPRYGAWDGPVSGAPDGSGRAVPPASRGGGFDGT